MRKLREQRAISIKEYVIYDEMYAARICGCMKQFERKGRGV